MSLVMAREEEIQKIGKQLLKSMEGRSLRIFKKDFWQGQIMEWSMKMPDFKVEMFRFVDVLPVLRGPDDVARHVQEYFCRPGLEASLPKSMRWGLGTLKPGSMLSRIAASKIEKNVVGMAKSFIAGEDARRALPLLKKRWGQGVSFSVDLLGEATVSEEEAQEYLDRYMSLIEELSSGTAGWKDRCGLTRDAFGAVPKVNVSIKLSSTFSQLDGAAYDHSIEEMTRRLLPLFVRAKALGVFLNLDMEDDTLKELTLDLFMSLLSRPELKGLHAGCVIQAYLRSSEGDLKRLIAWARSTGKVVTVRLVKGAYWDQENILAEQRGWPVPVYTDKAATDANFERLTRLLFEHHAFTRPAFGTHNIRSIAYAVATANALGIPKSAYEFQMLYGMADPLKFAVKKMGLRLREYIPIGELIPGMAYLVRRLLENTSNESWLRQRFVDKASKERLLARPKPATQQSTATGYPAAGRSRSLPLLEGPFVNEALFDFGKLEVREGMLKALKEVRRGLGGEAPLIIGGERRWSGEGLPSFNPADPSQLIVTSAEAQVLDAEDAIETASRAAPAWRDLSQRLRSNTLSRAAEGIRRRRFKLAALMVFEAGKSWVEADADVAEAIDFLEYYAREALRISAPRRMGNAPGELNHLSYEAKGIVAVIAPWNFPLAILAGMAAAALSVGNCVLLKPAEQTPAVAFELAKIFLEGGVHSGALAFLPGRGEVIGAHLVEHPDVNMITFTGSKEVGVEIIQKAATLRPGQRAFKKVVAELGGKNAIIVDSDADLDIAVLGVVQSAFSFQGQKCSACSRVIVLAQAYDAFVKRLVQATRALKIGPPTAPENRVGPVIDEEARVRIEGFIERGIQEATLALRVQPPESEGFYVGPTIFTGVKPHHSIAQEEIFGPVLCVLKADSFEEALTIALGTPYALTGGLFSRSPVHIQRARDAFRVGNLYINRSITGALVERQPFGGFQMSGMGSKAGGPDYLLNFVNPRVVTENTIRRGFAPEEP